MGRRFVTLAHGAGGKETQELLDALLLSRLEKKLKTVKGGVGLDSPDDAAAIPLGDGYLVATVDAYTVSPLTFPGGDIGSLAASGSINDVLMMGGRPTAMLDSVVVEEGFDLELLSKLMDSLMATLRKESVPLIGGDFKTMPRGQLDKIVITTVGLGIAKRPIVDAELRAGDKIIVTGTMGDHGATILALQQGVDVLKSGLKSDARPLSSLMLPLIEKLGEGIHAARDPTRGGLAMTLNDWAKGSGTVVAVDEASIPVKESVRQYLGMLGIDPLYLANEGAAVLGVDPAMADDVLKSLKRNGAKEAAIIGEARRPKEHRGIVLLKSGIGGYRILEAPAGNLVPRIC
ncbi:MAG TPA: hydrogenase expression/formation protein HypE [Conexivisphaerales archaeon]|nr:hydrogenase expression/formation protein HypE [Conexivisphaerales archaeon]